ncbi:single-stranded DNA-binding protein [Aneurinibacillus tyrosinisolvens]|uniref:single-stranded DNA-binding protein n=1 Tax=Aneurinibacillus tyrosinisolvens TaxID=1443435 RepID=UPI00063FB3CA|nr:single-stranded DNA-binding protein [Aneurinibacillus tyrosinisolvens]
MSINHVVEVGRLTKDPELRYTQQATAVCSFYLAVDRRVPNSQGEREADFLPVVVFGKQAENCAQYLKKGSQAGIDGRLQSRSYDNKEGKKVFVIEIVADYVQFLGSPGKKESNGGGGDGNPFGASSTPFHEDNPFANV